MFLGVVDLAAAVLERDFDEQPVICPTQLAPTLGIDLDEPRFGSCRYLAGSFTRPLIVSRYYGTELDTSRPWSGATAIR